MKSRILQTGVLVCCLGIILGAFGAHLIKNKFDTPSVDIWKTATLYQIIHGLGLILYGIYTTHPVKKPVYFCFLGGICVFSGSLYLLVLTQLSVLGAITPIGGILFISGWFLWFLEIRKKSTE